MYTKKTMNKNELCQKFNQLLDTPVLMFFICIGAAASIVIGLALKLYIVALIVFWTEGRNFFF